MCIQDVKALGPEMLGVLLCFVNRKSSKSEGPIHVITRIVCQLERAYIFSALEKKSRVCLVNKRRKTKEI